MYFEFLCLCLKRKNVSPKIYTHPIENMCYLHYYGDPYNSLNVENFSLIGSIPLVVDKAPLVVDKAPLVVDKAPLVVDKAWTPVECPHCISNYVFI